MRRRSVTTRLVLDFYRMLQEMVRALYDLERGTAIFVSGHISRRVAL